MSLRLRLYLIAVGVTAAALLAFHVPADLETRWAHYVGWTAICVVSELMWLRTITGGGTVSMASTANLATGLLWGLSPSIGIVSISTLVAVLFIQRKPWVRAVFNAAQAGITMWASVWVFALLGGPLHGLEGIELARGEATAARLVVPLIGLTITYFLANRLLVTGAVAWSSDRPYWRALREDWFFAERLLGDAAAFLLAPLMVISFGAVGYVGVLLFYAPLRMIFESDRRYLELRDAQKQLIHSERMAAKGEFAAEIGHELKNMLVAISGRSQILLREAERQTFEQAGRHAQIILEQSRRMEALANGLMDFSSRDMKIERVDINGLIQRTMEFVRTQNRFDNIEWDLRLAETIPPLSADPGQLQQVLLNLFVNAADAIREKPTGARIIAVTTHVGERGRKVKIVATDTGTGIAAPHLARIFEPHFTTKTDGHGFGLSTSYRIVTNHGGSITAESPPGQGATFTITLPLDGPGSWGAPGT